MMADRVPFSDFSAIDELAREAKVDPQHVRKARIAFFKHSLGSRDALAQLPPGRASGWKERIEFSPLSLARTYSSERDDAQKLVFRTAEGYAIESVVLKPRTGRVTLCVSSQVGCAAACRFCATGHMGVAQDLAPSEIVAQLSSANELLREAKQRVRNVVFMGMGEPMHNADAVTKAIGTLVDPRGCNYPPSRVLVSTVGVCDAWLAMVNHLPDINYALSLHSAVQSTREEIIPLARKYSLRDLKEVADLVNQSQSEKTTVMIEYLMLDGVNDSPNDVEALLGWLKGLRVHVNLIPFNPIADAPELVSSCRNTIERFGRRLREEGYQTTIRYSLGQDIDAACGQLVRFENAAVRSRIVSTSRTR